MMMQSLEELERDLQRAIQTVYLLLGPEAYQCALALQMLKGAVLSPGSADFDYSIFTAGQASTDEILEAANIYPMISKRRLVVVRDAEKLKDAEQELLTEALPSMSPRSTLVLIAMELDHRRKFYKTLRERYCLCEFPKLKGQALERWAEAFVHKRGYRMPAPDVRKIVELVGSDLQTLASEFEKLMLYAGTEKNIPHAAIEDLVRSSRQHGIFELISAVSQHDRNGALKSLAGLLGMGEHPLVVVTMLARHCRQMLIAKEGLQAGKGSRDIAAAAQIPPFILEQFLRQVRGTEMGSIQEMYVRLAAIDRQLKSSSLDGRILLESLICALV